MANNIAALVQLGHGFKPQASIASSCFGVVSRRSDDSLCDALIHHIAVTASSDSLLMRLFVSPVYELSVAETMIVTRD
ncbi:hypothetical protein [Bradyrhizobium sp.]|uniref:hypothetical protein n=1 Tax=Bradyrhizobium sp. TaxID=376 RepID=UPI003BB06295